MSTSYGEKKTSVWAWIGGGCAVLLFLLAVGVVGVGYMGYRVARNVGDTLKDPVQRTTLAKQILGCEQLPEGYYAVLSLSVPFHVADIVALTDREPEAQGKVKFGEHALIYIDAVRWGKSSGELDDYFSGKTQDPGVLSRNNINLDAEEIVTRGVIAGTPELRYVVQRGRVHFERESRRGLLTLVAVPCAGTSRTRLAIWIGPDPKPGEKLDEALLAGTTGDPKRIAAFMGQFKFCK